ncbi:MAG TPA: hypothetical protein VIR05_09595 [Luteimonas sp.]
MRAYGAGVRAMAGMVLAIAATGCATRGTSVDHRMLLPQGGDRVELESRELFVMPIALASPEPVFPETDAAAATIDVEVCAEIWLSADGDVTRVAPFHATPECAQGADPAVRDYAQAVGDALRRWEFTPAMICEFPPELLARRDEGDCRGPEVTVRRVPVRLNYAFTFSSRDGRRRVGVERQRSPVGTE